MTTRAGNTCACVRPVPASLGSALPQPPARTWVLVAGDFHRAGGMDRANAELAQYLCAAGATVHLVSFRVDPALAAHPNVRVHRAARLAGSHFLAQGLLNRLGRAVAAHVLARTPAARVLVNGANCQWSDLNWVHFVHRQWRAPQPAAPLWFRLKHAVEGWSNSRKERRVLRGTRVVIANSERTRTDLIRDVGVAADRVHTVYLGCGSEWQPVTPDRRAAARVALGQPMDRPLVVFVGAFGHDSRKGFDTLCSAWRALCARSDWNVDLIAAGGGRALPRWRSEVDRAGLAARVRLPGFSTGVNQLLDAADLLVSPVRYESYGLNVLEALCSGVPAIVSRGAGIAERYPSDLGDLLLPDPEDADDLVRRLLQWRGRIEEFKCKIMPLGETLRAWTWSDMAAQIVALADASPTVPSPVQSSDPRASAGEAL